MCVHLEAINVIILCSDPHEKGCQKNIGPFFGQQNANVRAEKIGWSQDRDGNWACPECSQQVNRNIRFD